MGVLLDAVLGLIANLPSVVGLVAKVRGPARRHVGEASPVAWAAAALLIVATVPLVQITWRLVLVAVRAMDDDLMWFLGLILFIPLAAVAVSLCATVVASAAVAGHGLLTDAEHGRTVFLTCALAGTGVGLFVSASGLPRHGLVTAGLCLLAAGTAGAEGRNA